MKVLVTGASGLLGSSLIEVAPHRVIGTHFSSNPIKAAGVRLDIRDPYMVEHVIQSTYPDLVIHTAAVGDVNFYDNHYSWGAGVNVNGSVMLADACFSRKIPFVYISSNAVYDGRNPPYSEKSERIPINLYGKGKLTVETYLEDHEGWMIIRPMLIYGWNYETSRANWATKILKKVQDEEDCPLVTDVYYQPTFAPNLAEIIWGLIESCEWNTSYNVASEKQISLFDFGVELCLTFGLPLVHLKEAKASDFGGPERPLNTCYDTTKIKNLKIEVLPIEEGFECMYEDLGLDPND